MIGTLGVAAALVAIGAVLGFLYFACLKRSVDLLAGGARWFGPAGWMLARLVGSLLVLGAAARMGAVPLLAVFSGFLVSRTIFLRRVRSAT